MVTFLVCLALLVAAYFTYGRYLERLCGADAGRPVPSAVSFDGVDYIPMPMWKTFLVQLLNIAGLGPILAPCWARLTVPWRFSGSRSAGFSWAPPMTLSPV